MILRNVTITIAEIDGKTQGGLTIVEKVAA